MQVITYFAYGSNLLRERLLARCPNLSFVGRASLPRHRLTFGKVSLDGSGKCAFEQAEGEEVLGVLWNVPEQDLVVLDKHEGVGHGYERCTVSVEREDGSTGEAVTYRATTPRCEQPPYDWYLALVVAGAMQQGLARVYIDRLCVNRLRIDADATRKTRCEALEALAEANMTHVFASITERHASAVTIRI
jgi:AIG2-like family.